MELITLFLTWGGGIALAVALARWARDGAAQKGPGLPELSQPDPDRPHRWEGLVDGTLVVYDVVKGPDGYPTPELAVGGNLPIPRDLTVTAEGVFAVRGDLRLGDESVDSLLDVRGSALSVTACLSPQARGRCRQLVTGTINGRVSEGAVRLAGNELLDDRDRLRPRIAELRTLARQLAIDPLDGLIRATSDPSELMRDRADALLIANHPEHKAGTEAMGRYTGEACGSLCALLEHEDELVRTTTIEGLARHGTATAVEPLRTLKGPRALRRAAKAAAAAIQSRLGPNKSGGLALADGVDGVEGGLALADSAGAVSPVDPFAEATGPHEQERS